MVVVGGETNRGGWEGEEGKGKDVEKRKEEDREKEGEGELDLNVKEITKNTLSISSLKKKTRYV